MNYGNFPVHNFLCASVSMTPRSKKNRSMDSNTRANWVSLARKKLGLKISWLVPLMLLMLLFMFCSKWWGPTQKDDLAPSVLSVPECQNKYCMLHSYLKANSAVLRIRIRPDWNYLADPASILRFCIRLLSKRWFKTYFWNHWEDLKAPTVLNTVFSMYIVHNT